MRRFSARALIVALAWVVALASALAVIVASASGAELRGPDVVPVYSQARFEVTGIPEGASAWVLTDVYPFDRADVVDVGVGVFAFTGPPGKYDVSAWVLWEETDGSGATTRRQERFRRTVEFVRLNPPLPPPDPDDPDVPDPPDPDDGLSADAREIRDLAESLQWGKADAEQYRSVLSDAFRSRLQAAGSVKVDAALVDPWLVYAGTQSNLTGMQYGPMNGYLRPILLSASSVAELLDRLDLVANGLGAVR